MSGVVGWAAHETALVRLAESFTALAPGDPVRLAKPTSNLFRPRSESQARGLDVSGLTSVIAIDTEARTADVQGMCTYEDLVDALLPHGFIPLVVPQLRTITLGGAVTGLGIEATSFRNGLPHESVLEIDVFTGTGEVVTTKPGDDLFKAFPNSYGSLGYATRLRIEIEKVPAFVNLRHVRFDDHTRLTEAIEQIIDTRTYDGERVDGLDGVFFQPGETYLTLATFSESPASEPSDYTGQQVFFKSLRERQYDTLTMFDYLWRWDTDWFWCSGAFGAQNPLLRRVWPRSRRRSDVYHRLLRTVTRYRVDELVAVLKRNGPRERVVQDIEVPVERIGDFLDWFDANVGMRPVWICPLRTRASEPWPLYPLEPGKTYVNAGFWGTVKRPDGLADGELNRLIESQVSELEGHKSLYSDAFYSREEFDTLYNGAELKRVKQLYDPESRLTDAYDKAVLNR